MTAALFLLVLGLLLALALLGVVLYLARQRAERAPGAPARHQAAAMAESALARVQGAFARLTLRLPHPPARYDVPLLMLAGEAGSGKTALLRASGLPGPGIAAGAVRGDAAYVEFDQGVVLETGSEFLALDAADAPLWSGLAAQLQRYRARRPLDGIVYCLPAAALSDRAALEVHAEALQRRLIELQEQIGLRLPLYLLVTQADHLEGFASLARSVPPSLRGAMVGWSNPQDPEAPYSTAWPDAAVDRIAASLERLQAALLARSVPVADPDAFFLLPSSIASVRVPLAAFLDRMLTAPAQREVPCLRGIYLCGDPGDLAECNPAFVHDVFAQKAFAEQALARPLRGQVFSRDRRAARWRLATVALVLVWGAALVHAWFDLGERAGQLLRTVRLIEQEQEERTAGRAAQGHLPPDWYRAHAATLVTAMASNRSTLRTAAVPQSWPWLAGSDLDQRIDERFRDGLAVIVFPAVEKSLNLKARQFARLHLEPVTTDLLDDGCDDPEDRAEAYTPQTEVGALTEFLALAQYVKTAAEFGHYVDVYQAMSRPGEGDVSDLRALGRYTEAFELPANHDGHETYFSRALNEYVAASQTPGKPEDPQAQRNRYRPGLLCGWQKRTHALYQRLLVNHPALLAADGIADNMEAGAGPAGRELETFEILQGELHNLKEWLGSPTVGWLHKKDPDFGAAYTELAGHAAAVNLLGPSAAETFVAEGRSGLHSLQARLLAAGGSANPIVERDADGGRLQLTPDLAHLEASLRALMRRSFMAAPPQSESVDRAGKLVLWDADGLQRTLALVADHHDYMAKEIGTFPRAFQSEVQQLSSRRVGANLLAGIAAARAPAEQPEEAWQRLGQLEKTFVALLDALQALGYADRRAALARELAGEAQAGLSWIDNDYQSASPYLPRDGGFGWWDGAKNPVLAGFAGGDPQGLDDYFAQQRDRIEARARMAQPLLQLLDATGGARDSGPARRWRGIVAELDRYGGKQPGNHVALLEGFIRTDLAETDLQNCQDKLASAGIQRGSDFFAQRTRELAGRLAARCAELGRTGVNAAYDQLAARFRTSLAHRFPFALPGADDALAADPDDVLDFLQAYDKLGVDAYRRAASSLATARQRDFLAAAGRVRKFLSPLARGPEGEAGAGYDISLRFRVNQLGEADGNNVLAGEVDGNKIVVWSLQVGDQTARWINGSKNQPRTLTWKVGMPIVLTLRWADNLASAPLDDAGDPWLTVRGHEVRYTFDEPWALLRMLARHRVPARTGSARFETLRFEFATVAPTPAGVPAPQPVRARVYLRMALTPAGQKEVLGYPGFPADVPPPFGLTTVQAQAIKPPTSQP